MRKRGKLVVLSSDDEDNNLPLSSKGGYGKKKFSFTVPRSNLPRTKKACLSGPQSRPSEKSNNANEFRLLVEDFDQTFSGIKLSTDCRSCSGKELWVDKYKPRSFEELVVHKKKIEEVKLWFEERLRAPQTSLGNHGLVISGPSGVGKSATVRVIASHLGLRLCEWDTPTPILWQEHLHTSNSGMQYTSKLEEFENFVERVRKYGVVPSAFGGEPKSSTTILIDDLPLINGNLARGRLQKCLNLLVRLTQIPTVILVTDCSKADSKDLTTQYLEDIQCSLVNAGACKVTFNPITTSAIKKVLSRICQQEQKELTLEQINMIVKGSGGDIRHAITSLQFFNLNSTFPCSPFTTHPPKHLEDDVDKSKSCDEFSFNFGRDETLSLFHALGKFLHNKREAQTAMVQDDHAFLLHGRLTRLPLKMDAPEKVLSQAHGQARPIVDFLHENVLDFLNEEAIDDAWTVASYLSDADSLLASCSRWPGNYNEAESVLPSAAASIAVRGVLFGNSSPLTSRWHAIRKPRLWLVEDSYLRNKIEMQKRGKACYGGLSLSNLSAIASEYCPVAKWVGYRESVDRRKVRERDEEIINSNNVENSSSEDEIQDW